MAGPTRGGAPGDEPLGDDDVAARWAEITERLGSLDVPPAPVEHEEPEAPRAQDAAPGPRDYSVEAEGEEGFVPPDPGPVALTDPVVTLGWAAVAGAVLALVVLPLVWHPLPGSVLGLVLAVLLAGTGLLLWRMPRSRDDGPPGGGAVL